MKLRKEKFAPTGEFKLKLLENRRLSKHFYEFTN